MKWKRKKSSAWICVFMALFFGLACSDLAAGADLKKIKERGVLYHLGIPYANFVTGSGDGLDVEVMKLFAEHLGVRYEYVNASWAGVIGDLTGKEVKPAGDGIEILGEAPIRGDVIANGLTVLPWRNKIVDYSVPTFPTQVWLVARVNSVLKPIQPSGDVNKDIASVIALLKGITVLGKRDTCLDPALYSLEEAGARVDLFEGNLNELAPAVVHGAAEATLLDVPDALIALGKWPGKIKVIGPISSMQNMAFAFAKESVELRDDFNLFFKQCVKNGTYLKLVEKYYPAVFTYYPEFFQESAAGY